MPHTEWIRTALAVERAGSITAGARDRGISQPAASQHLAGLERALGLEIFERHRSGVRTTEAGARFLREVGGAFDQLEWLLDGLDAGHLQRPEPALVIGCSPEWFERSLLPLLDGAIPLRARFGSDQELLDDLQNGRVDVAVTALRAAPSRARTTPLASKRYVLAAAAALVPEPPRTLEELANWVRATPWVGYSEELPVTRRFWQDLTGSLQPTSVCLVAPDLRIVAAAVERGLGASLLPSHVCDDAIADGRIVEVRSIADVVPPEPWFLSVRPGGQPHPARTALVKLLTVAFAATAPTPGSPGAGAR
ncbi:MAG: LysR family transcriptional regulator [Chloroflexi bacterium]|nr:LysR family transcriptional regulator [Chloroflexota bacterium]MDA1146076.1 LysR family transcriptional regulator [Chloroflexota bacterium]